MNRKRLSIRAILIPVVLAIVSLLLIHPPLIGSLAMAQSRSGKNKRPQPRSKSTTATVPRHAGAVVRNQLGMEFAYAPAGSFMMGSENSDEEPVHRVMIQKGFYIGRYEVTQAQWQTVMGNNLSKFKDCAQCPVENVPWDDVQEFIRKLNARGDVYTYRLPSEAEWEYACRAGTTGDYAGNLDTMAWYANNSGRRYIDADAILDTDISHYYERLTKNGGQTHLVGQKQANAFGLYDMHGNVWEWCEDWYHDSYRGAPVDGSAWLSGGRQKNRVLRGGSWLRTASDLRSADREEGYSDFREYEYYGFRVVASAR
jgi:formylglycine-generating enzyme required for sulfatase activity